MGFKNPGLMNAFNQEYSYSDEMKEKVLLEKLINHNFQETDVEVTKILNKKYFFPSKNFN